MKKTMMPLAFLSPGERARVKEIRGGITARKKLTDLGLIKDTEIKVLQNSRGPIIVSAGESRVALGFGMAQKVLVEEVLN
ncbi:MAG: FeoA family protein [Halanaerobiales bacterium]